VIAATTFLLLRSDGLGSCPLLAVACAVILRVCCRGWHCTNPLALGTIPPGWRRQGAVRSMPLALISGVVSGAISSRIRALAPSASFAAEATPAVYTV
jgi:hypothetical protein